MLTHTDVDECDFEWCGNDTECFNIVGSFDCICKSGYVMDGPDNCTMQCEDYNGIVMLAFYSWSFLSIAADASTAILTGAVVASGLALLFLMLAAITIFVIRKQLQNKSHM